MLLAIFPITKRRPSEDTAHVCMSRVRYSYADFHNNRRISRVVQASWTKKKGIRRRQSVLYEDIVKKWAFVERRKETAKRLFTRVIIIIFAKGA